MAAIALLALAKTLLLVAFLMSVAMATAQAQGDNGRGNGPACEGEDLLAQMQRDEPDRLAALRKAASGEPNGTGLLWRVEREGVAPSYLFGTMHMADPRVTALPAQAETAFAAADTVVIETLDILDPSRMAAVMFERPDLMMFTDDRSLTDLIADEDREMVRSALAGRGMPLPAVARTKPWILYSMLATPQCELTRRAAGAPVLDVLLAERARAEGKKLEGLETAADQLDAMASLPLDWHIRGLVETARLGDRVDDVMETMIALYRRGEIALIFPFFETVLPDASGGEEGYADFQHAMITVRNRHMVDEAAPLLRAGNAFVAVGALHLPGTDGIVELLRQAGWTVEPVPSRGAND